MLYADTSALAKLVWIEPESDALRRYLENRRPLVTSAIAVTELVRATRRRRAELAEQATQLLDAVILIEVDRELLTIAGTLAPVEMRTLDAIHIATALALGDELGGLVTYDSRMGAAATAVGLEVVAPA